MQFSNLDLNLLRVFLALMDEGNATRAGARLGLSPSAISHALSRLRERLGDPLFIRGSTSLRPTPRAQEMAPAVRRAMEELERAVSVPSFDPSTTEREFVLVASAYVCAVFLPLAIAALDKVAPRANLRIRPPEPGLAEALDQGRIDIVICSYEQVPARFAHEVLFEETAVWVVRADHPAAKGGLKVEGLSKLPRIAVSALDPWNGADPSLDSPGLKRPIGWSEDYMQGLATMPAPRLWVPDVHTALAMVSVTDMTALLPRRLVLAGLQRDELAEAQLEHAPPPARIAAVSLKTGGDTPVRWLTQVLQSVMASA
jgi:DNA-binding transcriptional LysR family regulator